MFPPTNNWFFSLILVNIAAAHSCPVAAHMYIWNCWWPRFVFLSVHGFQIVGFLCANRLTLFVLFVIQDTCGQGLFRVFIIAVTLLWNGKYIFSVSHFCSARSSFCGCQGEFCVVLERLRRHVSGIATIQTDILEVNPTSNKQTKKQLEEYTIVERPVYIFCSSLLLGLYCLGIGGCVLEKKIPFTFALSVSCIWPRHIRQPLVQFNSRKTMGKVP